MNHTSESRLVFHDRNLFTVVLLGGVLAGFVSFTIGATLPLIGKAFDVNTSQLGVLLGVFTAAFGLFQIPAGFLALKWGTRETFLIGLALVGVASVFSGLSTNIIELASFRVIVGIGAAFSSGTAYSLVASYYKEGEKGKSIGLFFGVTNGLGGVAGLPVALALAQVFGWSFPVQLGGILTLLVTLVCFLILPKDSMKKEAQIRLVWSKGRSVLGSRSIWALALGLAGFTAGAYVPIDFLTQYFSQAHPSWGINTAAAIAAVGVMFTLPGGILGGRMGERKGVDRRLILGISGAIFGLMLLAFPFLNVEILWPWYAVAGIFVGIVSTVINIVPAYLKESEAENLSLGIGIISSTQLVFTSVFAILFGIIVEKSGFTPAWFTSGLITLLLLPLLFLVSSSRPKPVA